MLHLSHNLTHFLSSKLKFAALIFALWTAFGFLSSTHFFAGKEAAGGNASYADLAEHIFVFYWAWAALTPLALFVARCTVPVKHDYPKNISIITCAAVALILVHGLLYLFFIRLVGVEATLRLDFANIQDYLMRHAGGDIATLAALLGVYILVDTTRRSRVRDIASAALQSQLAQTELELLRWQLQPHFLFNALNSVSTLVLQGDAPAADDAIMRISRYLRSALAQRADVVITLNDELTLVREYLAIETLRFGAELAITIDIADDALAARLPALLLQPMVENAIRFGASANGQREPIEIVGAIRGSRLVIDITNAATNDSALNGETRSGAGFGLNYVRQRLAHFYGAHASLLFVAGNPSRRAMVSLSLPLAV